MFGKVFACLLFAIAYAFPAFALDAYQHPDTQLVFPSALGKFELKYTHVYPQKPLGVAIDYASPNLGKLDFYVYDFGIPGIEDGVDSKPVRQMIEMADADIHKVERFGMYENLRPIIPMGSIMSVSSDDPVFEYKFLATAYELVVNHEKAKGSQLGEGKQVSILMVTGLKKHFLKVRYTYSMDSVLDGQAALDGLLTDFFKINFQQDKSGSPEEPANRAADPI